MDRAKRFTTAIPLGGGLLILAVVIMATGAVIPSLAPSLREAPWTDDPQLAAVAIAGNPSAYAWAHGLFVAAGIVTALGLVPVSFGFQGRSRSWALMGLVTFAFAAAFSAINRTINIEVYTWGAGQGLSVTDLWVQALMHFQSGLDHMFYILAYLTLGLYGIAMLQRLSPNKLGWVFVAGGILGILLHLIGGGIPAFVYFGTGALGAASWLPSSVTPEKATLP
jgi:hypothetical protein